MINFKNKVLAIALCVTMNCVAINAGGNENAGSTAASSAEDLRESCEKALKILNEAKPASLAGDIERDLVASLAAAYLQADAYADIFFKYLYKINNKLISKTGKNIKIPGINNTAKAVPQNKTPTINDYYKYLYFNLNLAQIPLFPIFSLLLSHIGSKNNNSTIDKALDTLISADNTPEMLAKIGINVEKLESKITNNNAQEKKRKLLLRITECIIMLVFTRLVLYEIDGLWYLTNTRCRKNDGTYYYFININLSLIISCLVEVAAMAYLIHRDNSSYKNSSQNRLEKLEKLKQLIESAQTKDESHGNEEAHDEEALDQELCYNS